MTESPKKLVYQRRAPGQEVGKERAMGPNAPGRLPRPFRHAVFASAAEYDASVESVVARIRSGQVQARIPDE